MRGVWRIGVQPSTSRLRAVELRRPLAGAEGEPPVRRTSWEALDYAVGPADLDLLELGPNAEAEQYLRRAAREVAPPRLDMTQLEAVAGLEPDLGRDGVPPTWEQ